MVSFKRYTLDNGLRVLLHRDPSTPFAAVNVLYQVGSRDEEKDKTGFAHLFEHLMFGGSTSIPDFDKPLQTAGGESNAFTNSDITNYYDLLPAVNLETALWLESDRMLSLDFSQRSLDVQRRVVVEEFKENYINQPYGDVWHRLLAMCYKQHSYRWPTIGEKPEHIEAAKLEDVKDFFFRYYRPSNAILVIAGGIEIDPTRKMIDKWFGGIEGGALPARNIATEPPQAKHRSEATQAEVPVDSLYKAFHMCSRTDPDYYAVDLISDLLSNGESSRLYRSLVKERSIFAEISAYVSGFLDPGLFIVEGKPIPGVGLEEAEQAVDEELQRFYETAPDAEQLVKVQNKVESTLEFSEVNVLHRAMNLAFFEMIGDAEEMNSQVDRYRAVQASDIRQKAETLFHPDNSSTLYYRSKKQKA